MDLAKATEDFKKVLNSFKSVLAFAEEVEKIGNLELEVKKANSAAEIAKKNLDEVKKQHTAALASVTEATLKAEEIVKSAKDRAESIVSGAKNEALKVVEELNQQKAKSEMILQKAKAEIIDAQAELAALKSEKEAISSKVKEIKSQISNFAG
jgi:dsDNA-specific endonuclease/ATPase MutS2